MKKFNTFHKISKKVVFLYQNIKKNVKIKGKYFFQNRKSLKIRKL